jgi:pectin methylesterase-like acyl-CoA thioesterase
MRLSNLIDGSSDFQDNHLYTTSTELESFLNQKQAGGDWESSQTFDTGMPHVEPLADCDGYAPCYASIQDAIIASTPPTVIFVAEGEYNENVSVTDGFTLEMPWSADFSCAATMQPVVIAGPTGP